MATISKLSNLEAQRLAGKWGCSTRTIRAWRADGVDLSDDLSVVCKITSSQNPSLDQLNAGIRNLRALSKGRPKAGFREGFQAGLRGETI